MPSLWIDLIGDVSLSSKHLEIRGFHLNSDGSKHSILRTIPLFDVDRVIATHKANFSCNALAELLKRRIPVILMNKYNGGLLGSFLPATAASGAQKMQQYQRHNDEQWCFDVAKKITEAKIFNQRRTLQKASANRDVKSKSVTFLGGLLKRMHMATSRETLMGIEGIAAASFLGDWATYLPEEFPFERRSKRPPLNPVNACISYLSSLLYSEVLCAINASGADPALGIIHATQNNRWSLALDLMEPFRPLLVEGITLDLFTHKILNKNSFEPFNGGIYLNQEGRKRLILRYETRINAEFNSTQRGHRTNLRQQILNSAMEFKKALEEVESYEPFKVN